MAKFQRPVYLALGAGVGGGWAILAPLEVLVVGGDP